MDTEWTWYPIIKARTLMFTGFLNGGGGGISLGFAPRSRSFAYMPYGIVGSIRSLSGIYSVRKSAEPTKMCSHPHLSIKKTT